MNDVIPEVQASHQPTDPLVADISTTSKMICVGKTKTYELIASGELKSTIICGRRLVLIASIHDFIARQFGENAA